MDVHRIRSSSETTQIIKKRGVAEVIRPIMSHFSGGKMIAVKRGNVGHRIFQDFAHFSPLKKQS